MTGGPRGAPSDSLAGPPAPDPREIDNAFREDGTPLRRFWLRRLKDETGISRTGRVLEGVLTQSGRVLVEWRPPHATLGIYKDLEEFRIIHVDCHPSCNEIVWLDGAAVPAPPAGLTVERLAALAEQWAVEDNAPFTPARFAAWLLPRLVPVSPGAPAAARLAPTDAMKRAAWDAISGMAASGAGPSVFDDAWIDTVLRAALAAARES